MVSSISLPLDTVFKLILENMKRSGNPIGVGSDICVEWSRGLDLPRGGRSVIYTSCMYQMAPYIKRFVDQIERLEGLKGSSVVLRLGSILGRFIDLSAILRIPEDEIKRSSNIIRNIVSALRRVDRDLGYLYEDEPYSGALLYELGLEEAFEEHIKKVLEIFRRYKVERVYTIDPHTHHVLKHVYPSYVEKLDLEVVHYLEVLSRENLDLKREGSSEEISYVIHDPCLLVRYSNIIDPQRIVLNKLNVRFQEPLRSRVRTRCCGGPIESIAPRVSGSVARVRLEELTKYSNKIIVMCPICYVSLSRYSKDYNAMIHDLAEFLG
ncbi:MAG: (Fe-S)-binding protein [Sulfolobales archaeon]